MLVEPLLAAVPAASPAERRWQIIRLQLRSGHEPCFGTERRHLCAERGTCEFRPECLTLRADWRR